MKRLKVWAACGLTLGVCFHAAGASARITKVLPHLLDQKGRHTLSPSLYERDAYQAHLRRNPGLRSALRFNVQWKARESAPIQLKVRVEIRGSKEAKPFVLEQRVRRATSRWTALTLGGEDYKKLGELVAWRATLWAGDALLAEEKSFLW